VCPEITEHAKAMGLRISWARFDGIVAQWVCWPGEAVHQRPAGGWGAGTGSEGCPVRGDSLEIGRGLEMDRDCLHECPVVFCRWCSGNANVCRIANRPA
jgi:hypothetical protein